MFSMIEVMNEQSMARMREAEVQREAARRDMEAARAQLAEVRELERERVAEARQRDVETMRQERERLAEVRERTGEQVRAARRDVERARVAEVEMERRSLEERRMRVGDEVRAVGGGRAAIREVPVPEAVRPLEAPAPPRVRQGVPLREVEVPGEPVIARQRALEARAVELDARRAEMEAARQSLEEVREVNRAMVERQRTREVEAARVAPRASGGRAGALAPGAGRGGVLAPARGRGGVVSAEGGRGGVVRPASPVAISDGPDDPRVADAAARLRAAIRATGN
jgi:hypothetical protein